MKEEFLNFLDKLMTANQNLTNDLMTDNIRTYIEALKTSQESPKPLITESGKKVLSYLQSIETVSLKAADIGSGLGSPTRTVSSALRKLVSDGYVEKIGDKPAVYVITEKGKEFKID